MDEIDVKKSKDGVFVRLTTEQKGAAERAAIEVGLSLATWVRTLIVKACAKGATDER